MKKFIPFIFILFLFLITPKAFAVSEHSASAKLALVNTSSGPDERVAILRTYLAQYNSPLTDSAEAFVRTADKYNLDWRLVAAISGLESGFGQHIPYNSYNGWGWGVYGDNVIRFASWDEGIETISKGLRERYLRDLEESDPYVIGPTYASSPTWAVRVSYFMASIQNFKVRNAKESLPISI